jgi:hypothetical protein
MLFRSDVDRPAVRTSRLFGTAAACVLLALVVAGHAPTRARDVLLSNDSQRELERLEHETFESPDDTYAETLSLLHHQKTSLSAQMSAATAWASPAWPSQTTAMAVGLAHGGLPTWENRIAADVSKTLATTIAKEVASALASAQAAKNPAQPAAPVPRLSRRALAQKKLLAGLQAQVASDKAKSRQDEMRLRWVAHRVTAASSSGSARTRRNALMNTFASPLSSVAPNSVSMPVGAEPQVQTAAGPSDTYNYWSGDHYHDESGPAGKPLNPQPSTHTPCCVALKTRSPKTLNHETLNTRPFNEILTHKTETLDPKPEVRTPT